MLLENSTIELCIKCKYFNTHKLHFLVKKMLIF